MNRNIKWKTKDGTVMDGWDIANAINLYIVNKLKRVEKLRLLDVLVQRQLRMRKIAIKIGEAKRELEKNNE
jgi:hypothetical protein